MENFNKDIYITKGCHLVARVTGDTSNMYQFVFNPETELFSDIHRYSNDLRYKIEEDGIYEIVTLKNEDAILNEDGTLTIGAITYDSKTLVKAIESNIIGIGEVDVDETISICGLKKCLANLEMKLFQDMAKNCGSIQCKNNEMKSQIDFLFIAV